MSDQIKLLQESLANLKRARERDAARIAELEAALEVAAKRLEQTAQMADNAHNRQEEAFDKWLKSKRGEKPHPAVGLPVAASEMRFVAAGLRSALLKGKQS